MSPRQDLERALQQLNERGRAAFAALCAAKAVPFVRRFGSEATGGLALETLDVLWLGADGQRNPSRVQSLRGAVWAAPEARADSASLSYRAGMGLRVLYYALGGVSGSGGLSDLAEAAQQVSRYCSALDYVESRDWPRPRTEDPQTPREFGPWEREEREDQLRWIAALANPEEVLEGLRAHVAECEIKMSIAAEQLARKHAEWLAQRGLVLKGD